MAAGSPFRENLTYSAFKQPHLLEHFPSPAPGPRAGLETWTIAWSKDAQYLAWSCGDCTVKVIPWIQHRKALQTSLAASGTAAAIDGNPGNIPQKENTKIFRTQELIWSLAFCPPYQGTKDDNACDKNKRFRYKSQFGLLLAVGLNSGRIRVWDIETGLVHFELMDHTSVVRDLAFSPDSSYRLISASRDGSVKVWEFLEDGNMCKTLKTTAHWLYCCAWSPDGALLCAGGDHRMATIWNSKNFQILHQLRGHLHTVSSCEFSPDGALLATASHDTWVTVWDVASGEKLLKLQHFFPAPSLIFAGGSNGSYVRSVSFSPDGNHVTTVCDDSFVRFWNLSSSEKPRQVTMVPNALCCSYSPDGSLLAVGTRNGSVSLWMAPMCVQSLQNICRVTIRQLVTLDALEGLGLPKRLHQLISQSQLTIQQSEE